MSVVVKLNRKINDTLTTHAVTFSVLCRIVDMWW